jgi:hypothetical protein
VLTLEPHQMDRDAFVQCGKCFSTDIDTDNNEAGQAVCLKCGFVLQETNHIVSDLSFTETSNGAPSVFGQFISSSNVARCVCCV